MSERPFKEKSMKPTDEKLDKTLGVVSEYFQDLKKLTNDFQHLWNFSKSSGWMEKVEDKKNDSFIISMAVREKEKEYFITEEAMADYKEM